MTGRVERGVGIARPLAQQRRGLAAGFERRHAHDALSLDTECFATGREHHRVAASRLERRDDGGDLGDEMLAVVDHEQQSTIADPVDDQVEQRLFASCHQRQRRRQRGRYRAFVGHRGEIDEVDAVRKVADSSPSELDRRAGLADPPGAGQGDHAGPADEVVEIGDQPLGADELGGRTREVGAAAEHAAQLGERALELRVPHLVERDRADVAKSMHAERLQGGRGRENPGVGARRLADDDLATVSRGRDTCCVMDRQPDEVVVKFGNSAEVQSHAHPQL